MTKNIDCIYYYTFILYICLLISSTICELNNYEKEYVKIPQGANVRDYLKYYSSEPHIAGSQRDYETAVYTSDKFKEFGLNATIQAHEILVNYPLKRNVQLLNESGAVLFTAIMQEPAVAQDPTSNNPNSVPTFNAYSPSGNVTAPFVYVNYGRYEDFMYLEKTGINITGKIAIVRYGQIFRGTKAMLAQKFGAVGVLIYSDPFDDGYYPAGGENNTFPTGPWRPEQGVQRGSVQYWSICPGSPSDERVTLCLGPDHVNESYVGLLTPSIPVQPLSWGDAEPLLSALSNSLTALGIPDDSWQGKLNFTYKIGPSTELINLHLEMNFTKVNIWTVVAKLESNNSDDVVIVGNHRDAWVFGASDPSSGSSVLLEIARSIMVMANSTNWKPKRDILFCSWDAEEYGLMGSTAWAENNTEYLKKHAVAYLNVDMGAAGKTLKARGSPSLLKVMEDITSDLPYPADNSKTVMDVWKSGFPILGSGSDYTVFVDHLGIPSIDMTYSDPPNAGIYHSIYDSFYWMDTFGDPGFKFHQGISQLLGVLAIRFAGNDVVPLGYSNYAKQLQSYFKSIQNYTSNVVVDGKPVAFDFSALESAIVHFVNASGAIDAQVACVNANNTDCVSDMDGLNQRLQFAERRFLINTFTNESDGLPARPWFKHVVQAPGLYDGYGAQIFPGIAQGVLDNKPDTVNDQIIRTASSIMDAASALTELSVAATPTSNVCFGQKRGSITLDFKGGFSPLKFSLNAGEWQSSSSFSNLLSGVYNITVKDARGLTSATIIYVSQPSKIVPKVEVYSNNTAVASATGGVGNYTFRWSHDNATSSVVVLPKNDDYRLFVTDGNNCTEIYSFNRNIEKRGYGWTTIFVVVMSSCLAVGGFAFLLFRYFRRRNAQKYARVHMKEMSSL